MDIEKQVLKYEKYSVKENNKTVKAKKGDIWTVDYGVTVGSEIYGVIPSIVLTSSSLNDKTNQVIVCPIFSNAQRRASEFFIPLYPSMLAFGGQRLKGFIKTDTIRTFSSGRLGQRVARLNDIGWDRVSVKINKIIHLKD